MLAFVNAGTMKIEAVAQKPWWWSQARFDKIEAACRQGRAYDVSKDMLFLMDRQPHPDCFLLPR